MVPLPAMVNDGPPIIHLQYTVLIHVLKSFEFVPMQGISRPYDNPPV